MSEQEYQALQQWQTNDLLEGVRWLMTVSEVNSLTDLFRLNELAESYREKHPLHPDYPKD